MLSVTEALQRVLAHTPAGGAERVPVGEALGRVLAEEVITTVDLPSWDNSAMDGFAVLAADVPGELEVIDTVAAGGVSRRTVVPGTAIRIMTGAPVPAGADTVVMVEDTEARLDRVVVKSPAIIGQHIRRRGSDVLVGETLMRPGRVLHAGALGVAAAIGLPSLKVATRPRVAILSTGDEVVEAGRPLGPGQLWSSNIRSLDALVRDAGGIPVDLGNVPDDPTQLREAFQEALRHDLVVSTGGVSVGDFDHVKPVLGSLGVSMDFWRVAMKPGKPLAFGTLGGRPVFGLPGNPVSCMVNFLQFVRPVMRKMMGDEHPFLPVVEAELEGVHRRHPHRPEFLRVRLEHVGGRIRALLAGGHQGSGNLVGMAEAHGFVLVDAATTEVTGPVKVQVFDLSFFAARSSGLPW